MMNKTTFFAATLLSLGLASGQAADKVHFEDDDFSGEGWSEFIEVPDTGGWEVIRRELGNLVQGRVQEVTLEGDGGLFLSAGRGSYASLFRSNGLIHAVRTRDGAQSIIDQVDSVGTVSLRLGFDGAFLIYEYHTGEQWNRLAKSDIVGVVPYTGGISSPSRADGMSAYRVVELESLKGVRFGYTNTPKIPGTPWVVHDPFPRSRARSIPAP